MKRLLYAVLLAVVFASCSKNDAPVNNKRYEQAAEELNIAYGTDALQKMDIYFPEGYNKSTPVIFYIHGGAFVAGTKDDVKKEAKLFMSRGYVVVNLSHRLVDATGLDKEPPPHQKSAVKVVDQVADVAAAVQKYKAIADSKGVGAEKMYMAGHSAGATLAMLYVQGDKNKDRSVRASANLAGLTNVTLPDALYDNPPSDKLWPALKELLYRMSGAELTRENGLYLMAISADWVSARQGGRPNISVMPNSNDDNLHFAPYKSSVAEAQNYDKQLKAKGVSSAFVSMETDHGFGNHPGDWDKAIDYVVDFFRKN